MLSVLHGQYHTCWCSGNFRSQGISMHGIDPQSPNINSFSIHGDIFFWPSDATWWHRSRSTLAQVMNWCRISISPHPDPPGIKELSPAHIPSQFSMAWALISTCRRHDSSRIWHSLPYVRPSLPQTGDLQNNWRRLNHYIQQKVAVILKT